MSGACSRTSSVLALLSDTASPLDLDAASDRLISSWVGGRWSVRVSANWLISERDEDQVLD